jgi:hypothetical protein
VLVNKVYNNFTDESFFVEKLKNRKLKDHEGKAKEKA